MELLGTFLEGLLSFLSPCVLPLIPLYMAYMAEGASIKDEEGNVHYNQITVLVRTLFFVFGILIAICLMALSVDFIKQYIQDYQDIIAIAGAVVIFIFGLHETGLIEINVLNREFSFSKRINLKGMNVLKAFVFGFLFTFAWSPCIGPMLSSALLLSLSSEIGVLYLLAYGIGFVLPFIACGLFTGFILNFIKKYKKAFRYVNIVAGIVLMGFAIYMFYGSSNNIVNMIHQVKNASQSEVSSQTVDDEKSDDEQEESTVHYISDTLYFDQDGNEIVLSNFKGKYLFINYGATWCTYCTEELPEFESFCDENEVACLLAMSPEANGSGVEEIKEYHEYHKLHTPIVVDSDNSLMIFFGIQSYPTTWVIGPDSSIVGYTMGAMDKDGFKNVLDQATLLYESR